MAGVKQGAGAAQAGNVMKQVKKIDCKIIHIIDMQSGKVTKLQPRAVESCMHPGTFLITPIEVWEDEGCVEYRLEDTKVVLDREAIAEGRARVEEYTFVPDKNRVKPSCNPCRNCGRC